MEPMVVVFASFLLMAAESVNECANEQAFLAHVAAAALEAEELCALPGEAERMRAYVQMIQPAFDVASDTSDAKAVAVALSSVRFAIRKMGQRRWCELYLRERGDLFQGGRAAPPAPGKTAGTLPAAARRALRLDAPQPGGCVLA